MKHINIKKSQKIIISIIIVLGALWGILEIAQEPEKQAYIDAEFTTPLAERDRSEELSFVNYVIDGDTIKVNGNYA